MKFCLLSTLLFKKKKKEEEETPGLFCSLMKLQIDLYSNGAQVK